MLDIDVFSLGLLHTHKLITDFLPNTSTQLPSSTEHWSYSSSSGFLSSYWNVLWLRDVCRHTPTQTTLSASRLYSYLSTWWLGLSKTKWGCSKNKVEWALPGDIDYPHRSQTQRAPSLGAFYFIKTSYISLIRVHPHRTHLAQADILTRCIYKVTLPHFGRCFHHGPWL